jgi:hypothetical protein
MSLLIPEMPSSPTAGEASASFADSFRVWKVEDHAGIHGARPRPHAEAVERGESEGAVDALALP